MGFYYHGRCFRSETSPQSIRCIRRYLERCDQCHESSTNHLAVTVRKLTGRKRKRSFYLLSLLGAWESTENSNKCTISTPQFLNFVRSLIFIQTNRALAVPRVTASTYGLLLGQKTFWSSIFLRQVQHQKRWTHPCRRVLHTGLQTSTQMKCCPEPAAPTLLKGQGWRCSSGATKKSKLGKGKTFETVSVALLKTRKQAAKENTMLKAHLEEGDQCL